MSSYQVIAKQFRPKKFSEVMEQKAIVQTLKNALLFKRISHAYLFCGSRGTGKTTLARLFAKAINCEKRCEESKEPCNSCPSCAAINEGNSLDVVEIDGASNRGIEEIRSLKEKVGYAPSSSPYKIYIIDEVHMLTKEAFNALLKTLEEPPAHVLFFFATTEPHKILATILSRCQRFDLHPIGEAAIQTKLTAIVEQLALPVEKEALALIARRAEGSLRDAESLLDQLLCFETPPITEAHAIQTLGLLPRETLFRLDEAVKTSDLTAAFSISGALLEQSCHYVHILEELADHYRTLLLTQMGTPSPLPSYKEAAAFYTKDHTIAILELLITALERAQTTPFKRIHLEATLLRIIRGAKNIPIESLVERLEKLQASLSPPTREVSKQEKEPPPPPTPPSLQDKIRQERAIRFAAAELQGFVKK